MKIKILCFVLLVASTDFLTAGAAPLMDATTKEPQLTGYTRRNEDLTKFATDIITGQFTFLGSEDLDIPGAVTRTGAKVQVRDALKGSVSGIIQTLYIVSDDPKNRGAVSPILGVDYIMFMQKRGPNHYEIAKLVPATDENIAKVKALIAVAPAPVLH